MHDLDRTSFETNGEGNPYELESEWELPGGTFDRPFSEAELDELALELLQVRDEQELDQFLPALLLKAVPALLSAAPAIGRFVRSPAGNALKGILKNALTAAVPGLGGLIGSPLAPGGVGSEVGAAIRGELEWEGTPNENRDVEAAKKVIQVGGVAAQQVATMPPNAPPQAVVDAVKSAAQQQGISTGGAQTAQPSPNGGMGGDTSTASGQWFRRGRSIVVVGL
jgi:hypothetical protein